MRLLLLAVAGILAACSPKPPPEPVMVFAASDLEPSLAASFEAFSKETGIPVVTQWGVGSDQVDALIEKTNGPADILVTDGVMDIWRAADSGALRPLQSEALADQPQFLRDPDGYWAAIEAYSFAVLQRDDAQKPVPALSELGSPDLEGRVCTVTSASPHYRALLAFLIDELGAREAERLVRRWVRNLVAPPFATDAALRDAVRTGACRYGIVRVRVEAGGTWRLLEPRFADVAGIGVGRHAGNAESAQRLVDWFLRTQVVALPGSLAAELKPVHRLGWRNEEAGLMAERAGYR